MDSCNGCDVVNEKLNSNGYCVDCQIEQALENGNDTEVCVYCARDKNDLHTGDCVMALAMDFADGCAGEEYQAEAREAYAKLHEAGVI